MPQNICWTCIES